MRAEPSFRSDGICASRAACTHRCPHGILERRPGDARTGSRGQSRRLDGLRTLRHLRLARGRTCHLDMDRSAGGGLPAEGVAPLRRVHHDPPRLPLRRRRDERERRRSPRLSRGRPVHGPARDLAGKRAAGDAVPVRADVPVRSAREDRRCGDELRPEHVGPRGDERGHIGSCRNPLPLPGEHHDDERSRPSGDLGARGPAVRDFLLSRGPVPHTRRLRAVSGILAVPPGKRMARRATRSGPRRWGGVLGRQRHDGPLRQQPRRVQYDIGRSSARRRQCDLCSVRSTVRLTRVGHVQLHGLGQRYGRLPSARVRASAGLHRLDESLIRIQSDVALHRAACVVQRDRQSV